MLSMLIEVPKDQMGWDRFAYHNRASHDLIDSTLKAKKGIIILDPVTYPIDDRDWNAWLLRHALQHQQMDTATNNVSNDLSSLDREDAQAVAGWIMDHWFEHQVVEAALGISS